MVEEQGMVIHKDTGLAPREAQMQDMETRFAVAIRQRELLEEYIRLRLKPDKHFYSVNKGQDKPSLKKEGAELINLPHNYKAKYSIISGPSSPPTDNAPYQLTVKAELWNQDRFGGEGIGSASSYQTTKDGSYQPRQKDPGLCYNATIKMAQKSAFIAATLNSTAASEFFTQDLEDDQTGNWGKQEEPNKTEHWCELHQTNFFKRGKMKRFAHPIEGTHPTEWCNEGEVDQGRTQTQMHPDRPSPTPAPADDAQGSLIPEGEETPPETPLSGSGEVEDDETGVLIDMSWLKESLKQLGWTDWMADVRENYGATGKNARELVGNMTPDQQKDFAYRLGIKLADKAREENNE